MLSGRDDPRDRHADGHHVAFVRLDAREHSIGRRLDLDDGFVGFHLEERLAFADGVAFLFNHETIFPVSCAISSAGMTTLAAISSVGIAVGF